MFGFQWHLTDHCNRQCRHCYQGSHDTCFGELSPGDRRKATDRIFSAISNERVTVNLTGGEPMILADLVALISHIESYNNLEEINIITNATIDNPVLLREVSRSSRFSSFRISIESGNAAVNDAIRGPGSLKNLERTIPLYKAVSGRPVTLMMTLSKLNLATINETIAFGHSVGADGILFERFVPLGSGTAMTDAVLSADDWHYAVKAILQAAELDLEPDSLAQYRAFGLDLCLSTLSEDRLEAALCNLGNESMALMPDGTVFPCRRLEIPVGNIMTDPFQAIRERLEEWFCSRARTRLHGTICGICPFEDCPGCRALARALTGDPLEDDPQCILNRKATIGFHQCESYLSCA